MSSASIYSIYPSSIVTWCLLDVMISLVFLISRFLCAGDAADIIYSTQCIPYIVEYAWHYFSMVSTCFVHIFIYIIYYVHLRKCIICFLRSILSTLFFIILPHRCHLWRILALIRVQDFSHYLSVCWFLKNLEFSIISVPVLLFHCVFPIKIMPLIGSRWVWWYYFLGGLIYWKCLWRFSFLHP